MFWFCDFRWLSLHFWTFYIVIINWCTVLIVIVYYGLWFAIVLIYLLLIYCVICVNKIHNINVWIVMIKNNYETLISRYLMAHFMWVFI